MRTVLSLILILCSGVAKAQWLPEAEQASLKSLWPAGVPFPPGLKFYALPPAYQQLKILDSRDYLAFHTLDQDRTPEGKPLGNTLPVWRSPGGLAWSDKRQWRNAVALAIPDGKAIEVWTEKLPVPMASRHLPGLRWAFPDGTVAVDMLIRKGEQERCFEVRVREKIDGRWDDGTAYRPFGEVPTFVDAERSDYEVDLSAAKPLRVGKTRFAVWDAGPLSLPRSHRFRPSTVVVRDGGDLIPHDYIGPGLSCRKCHEPAGSVQDYASALRGGDTVLTWYPAKVSSVSRGVIGSAPVLDDRWPIRRK